MKKRKRMVDSRKNFFIKRRLLFFVFLVFVIFSYLEISGKLYVTGYLKDLLFYPSRNIVSNEFINGIDLTLKNENIELKRMLSISNSLSDFEPIYASVVERDASYWFNYITINKGSVDGIEEGMAVVDSFGLVGIVEKVSFNNSVVSLITSNKKNNNVSVKIMGDDEINKILSFSHDELIIEGIDMNYSVELGTYVFTNGLGNRFPSGILVGSISYFDNDIYNTGKIIKVSPAANLNNLMFVAVLRRG